MSGEVTLEQVLALVPEEGHAIHIYDQEGNDYFCGYKDSINEEEPVPDLVLTGLYCNTENLKDGSGEIPVIEMEVSPNWTRRLLAAIAAIDGAWMRAAEKKLKRKYKGREWPDAAEPQQMARHILQVRQREDFK